LRGRLWRQGDERRPSRRHDHERAHRGRRRGDRGERRGPRVSSARAQTAAPASTGAAIAARLRRLEGGGLRTFAEDPPLVWERAEGCRIIDADGKDYLDLYGGFAVAAIGYRHPEVGGGIPAR